MASADNISWYDRKSRYLTVGGNLEVLSGTNITLRCRYSGFPQPEAQWMMFSQQDNTSEPNTRYQIINGSLVLLSAQPSDSGRYVCRVYNLAGTSSEETHLTVTGKFTYIALLPILDGNSDVTDILIGSVKWKYVTLNSSLFRKE